MGGVFCTNGDKCSAKHTTDPTETMIVQQHGRARREGGIKNKSYGWCHLVVKGLECPYKECIHSESLEAEADNAAALIAMEEAQL